MATRLTYNDLPEDIKKAYKPKEIYKISKPNKTLINVHLTNHSRINWKKSGDNWAIMHSAESENEPDQ